MAVSGTYNFNLDIDEVIQEAMEMIGGEDTLGHEPASARRSINLMLRDWQNRGILLWTTSVSSITVIASTGDYSLAGSTLDALEVVPRLDFGSENANLRVVRFVLSVKDLFGALLKNAA